MKRKLNYFGITAAAAALMLASCSQELEQVTPITDGDIDVTCVVSPEGLNEVTTYSVDDMKAAGYQMRYVLEVYSNETDYQVKTDPENATKVKRMVQYADPSTSTVTFEYRVPQGDYATLVWVDYVEDSGSKLDDASDDNGASYTVADLYDIGVKYSRDVEVSATGIGTEYRDAFSAYVSSTVVSTLSATQTIKPAHVGAKVNLLTSDIADLYVDGSISTKIKSVTLSYYNDMAGYNVATDNAIVGTSREHKIKVTYSANFDYTSFADPANIASDYVLVNPTGLTIQDVEIETEFYDRLTPHTINKSLAPALEYIPVAEQTQTNILGDLLTSLVVASVTPNVAWLTDKNVSLDTTTAAIVDESVQGTTQVNPLDYNDDTMTVATITIPSTKADDVADPLWSDYITLQNSATTGADQIINDIELVQATEDSYNVVVKLNQNNTAYIRQVKLRIYYTTGKYYDQTIYQGCQQTSGTSFPSLTYISGVNGCANTMGTYNKDAKYNSGTLSLIDGTPEEFKITSAYGEYDSETEKYYNVFDVVVSTKRNPATLKLVATSAEDGKTTLANTYTIGNPTWVTSATNWTEKDTADWDATTAKSLKFTVKVLANTAESTTKTQFAYLQLKDYPMLALGVAAPTYDTPSTAGTFGTLVYTDSKDNTYTAQFQIEANNIFADITDTNRSVQYAEYDDVDDDGNSIEYYPVTGATFDVTIRTNKILGTEELLIGDKDVLSCVESVESAADTDDAIYGIKTYTYNFTVAEYTGTATFESSKYTIYAETYSKGVTTTTSSAYSKTVYQNGNYHALSQLYVAGGDNNWKYGYLSGESTCVYATVDNTETIDAGTENETYTFYIRTNMVTTATALKELFNSDTATCLNATAEQISVSKKGDANVYYSAEYWRVYNFGYHSVFQVDVEVPNNTDTTATKKYVYSFPAPNGVDLTPTVTITRSKYVAPVE